MTILIATVSAILVYYLPHAGIMTCVLVHKKCLYCVITSALSSDVCIEFVFVLDKCEVIVYVMLWYSIFVGWIAPDMASWA